MAYTESRMPFVGTSASWSIKASVRWRLASVWSPRPRGRWRTRRTSTEWPTTDTARRTSKVRRQQSRLGARVADEAPFAETDLRCLMLCCCRRAESCLALCSLPLPRPDIGGEYDATFAQPSHIPFRFVLTTPSLWSGQLCGRGSGNASLALTSVHSADGDTAANNEQVTGTVQYCTTFGAASVHTPPVKAFHGDRFVFHWNRPIHLDSTLYACLPTQSHKVAPTIKLTHVLKDVRSEHSLGLSSRLQGQEFMHTLQSKGRYGSFTTSVQNATAAPAVRTISGSVATTLYRDAVANRTVTGGVQLDSHSFDSRTAAFPQALQSVHLKFDYDDPAWSVDTTLKASQADKSADASAYQLSEAQLRVMYSSGTGPYPRWCAGVSGGLVGKPTAEAPETASGFRPHEEPGVNLKEFGDFVGQLTTPVVSGACYYQLNRDNKFKLSVDSNRRVRSTYTYALSRNVSFAASFQALFPAFNVKSIDSVQAAGQQATTSLGLTINVVAE